VNLVIRRITIAVLAALIAGAVVAVPTLAKSGPQAVASKKAKKKCKKGKKGKKKKGCKTGGGSTSGSGLPGQATPDKPTNPAKFHVSSIDVAPNPILATHSATGQVTIDTAAPSSGQQVNLQSDSARATVPSYVVIAPGQKNGSFPVNTTAGGPATAYLTGSIGASNQTVQVNVVDTVDVSSVKLERQCFTPFGPFASNRVSLNVPAPADTQVGLTSTDSSALQVPAGVTVPNGSISAFFGVNALAASASVTVTATLGATQATDTASVSATDPATHAADLSVNPDTVVSGEGSTATVTLDCEAPPGGTTVTMAGDAGINVPASVLVPAGQLSFTFPFNTDANLADGQYDISAVVGADTPVHATLTIDSTLPT